MKPDFSKYSNGLIPAIIQDNDTQKILMLGYMDEPAYNISISTKRATFFSRSREKLWVKGETSGNYLQIVNMYLDCDADSLLIKVQPAGPTCHTGADTCFNEKNKPECFLVELEQLIQQRKENRNDTSYVSSLFDKGLNKVAQKTGEEAIEFIIEATGTNDVLFKEEAADLLFHYLVLLQVKGMKLKDIKEILRTRNTKSTLQKLT